uniref:Uncharacterized protein n=1 Tax=Arundo donax TaxID=35708 RepID=A0A0A9F6S6_ARUDO
MMQSRPLKFINELASRQKSFLTFMTTANILSWPGHSNFLH